MEFPSQTSVFSCASVGDGIVAVNPPMRSTSLPLASMKTDATAADAVAIRNGARRRPAGSSNVSWPR